MNMSTSGSQRVSGDLERQYQQQRPSISAYSDFTRWRRCSFVMIVTFMGSLSPLAATIHSPLYQLMSEELNVSLKALENMMYMFVFVSAGSALVWAQLSDVYGRRCVYLNSLSLLFVSNSLLTALPSNIKTFYGLKVLQAIGSSSVYSVGIATIADVIPYNTRGKCIGCFMIGPFLGLFLGPIISIDHFQNQWRWAFGLLTVMTGISILLVFLLLPETARSVVGTGKYFSQGQPKYTLFQQRVVADDYLPNQKFHWVLYLRLPCHVVVLLACSFDSVIFSCFCVMSTTVGEMMAEYLNSSPRSIAMFHRYPVVPLMVFSIISGIVRDIVSKHASDKSSTEFLHTAGFFFVGVGEFVFACCVGTEEFFYNDGCFGMVFFSATASIVLIDMSCILTTYVEDFPASAIALCMLARSAGCAISYFVVQEVVKGIGRKWCFVIFMVVCMSYICISGCSLMACMGSRSKRRKFHYQK